MNWEATSTIAGIVSAIAVVVTLIFLVLEIRRNTREMSRRISVERTVRAFEPFLTASGMSEIHAKIKAIDGVEEPTRAFMEAYGLSSQEAFRWFAHLALNWWTLANDFDFLGPSARLVAQIRQLLAYADNRLFWKISHGWFSAEFTAYVEESISGAGE